MTEPLVLAHWEARRCRIVLNRPAQGNAFSAALVDALGEALDEAEAREAEVVVIEGAGRHFCTGFDLSNLDAETDDSLLGRFVRIELLLQRVARLPMPAVALAHGRAMGAGADLFTACAVRVACADASFAFPGARGFGLALGSRRLAACVGAATARDWIASGRTISCEEARQAGLVNAAGETMPCQALPADVNPWVVQAIEGSPRAHDALDLDALARSAAQPGLKERIRAYVQAQAAARAQPSGHR